MAVNATAAWTEATDTAALTAALAVTANPSWTEASDTAALSASLGISTTLAWTEAADTAALAAALGITATAAWAEADDSAALTGQVGDASSGITTGSNKRRPQIQWLPAHVPHVGPYIATPPRRRPRKKRDAELLFLGR